VFPSATGDPFEHFPAEHVPAARHVVAAHFTGVPAHTPALQESYSVQASPSSQVVPFFAGFVQNPVVVSHWPALWHWSEAEQVPGACTQVPVAAAQVVHPEHALPVFCQTPLASQVCGWEPLHCFAPGVQAPEHAPVALLQRWGQAVPLSCHAPLALQVWGCSPLHCADVGLQEPPQAPVALLQR
jgi:hypothetical protein